MGNPMGVKYGIKKTIHHNNEKKKPGDLGQGAPSFRKCFSHKNAACIVARVQHFRLTADKNPCLVLLIAPGARKIMHLKLNRVSHCETRTRVVGVAPNIYLVPGNEYYC